VAGAATSVESSSSLTGSTPFVAAGADGAADELGGADPSVVPLAAEKTSCRSERQKL
jgi:hypothetical protein